MNAMPCDKYLLEWAEASKLTPPELPPVRTKDSPIIKWEDPKPSHINPAYTVVDGVLPDGKSIQIQTHWDGWKMDGVTCWNTFDQGHIHCKTFEEAKTRLETDAREHYQSKMEKARDQLAHFMYCLGLDHPLSVHQRL